jgi:hypothetical protein
MDEITEKLMEKLKDMVNQTVQMGSRNNNTPQIKNLRRHRNNYMNSERMSINTKVKQETKKKNRYMK